MTSLNSDMENVKSKSKLGGGLKIKVRKLSIASNASTLAEKVKAVPETTISFGRH